MKVYDSFESITERLPAVVAVGVFDGLHLGHQSIIRNAIDDARRMGTKSAVITFEPHPEEVLSPSPPPRLSGPDLKLKLLSGMNPDIVLRIPFDRQVAAIPAEDFIELLMSLFDLRGVVVGANFHFGRGGKGTPGSLVQSGNRFGFEVDLVGLLQIDNDTVSSTLIRKLIKQGDIQGAKNRLGRPPMFTGKVVTGEQRGRRLGFETANVVSYEPGAVPGPGVYAASAVCSSRPDQCYAAALSIGTQPTFFGDQEVTEVHLLDFDGDIYGDFMQVEVCARIRDQIKFDSAEQLAEQIGRDIEQVRAKVMSSRASSTLPDP